MTFSASLNNAPDRGGAGPGHRSNIRFSRTKKTGDLPRSNLRYDSGPIAWGWILSRSTALIALLAVATAADETWHTFRGNAQLTGVAPNSLPTNLHLLWTYPTEDAIESTAAIHQNTVYIPSLDTFLYALDLQSGALKWRYAATSEIRSSPTIAESTLYFGDEGGTFHAVDIRTGQPHWTFTANGGITSTANYTDNRIYFGSYDQHLYCLDATTGSEIWKIATDGYIHSTPVLYEDLVATAGCDGQLRLLDLEDGRQRRMIPMGTYVASSAAVLATRAYVGTFGNEVLAVDLKAGVVVWRYQHAVRKFPFYSSPAISEWAAIIGGRDKMVHALDPDNGTPLWTYNAKVRVDSSPVIAGNRVYFGAGALIALDLATGTEVWRFETGASITASPAIAAGRLIIGATDGVIYSFGQEVIGNE